MKKGRLKKTFLLQFLEVCKEVNQFTDCTLVAVEVFGKHLVERVFHPVDDDVVVIFSDGAFAGMQDDDLVGFSDFFKLNPA